MLLSGAEMKYFLDKTVIHIEFPNHARKGPEHRHERSFAELLCMSSRDMAYGYRYRKEVKTKAVKLHSKLISSVILSVLANHEPGYQSTEHQVVSWDRLKKEKLWLKIGIKIGPKEIRRLDWVIHGLLISDGDSVQRWINSILRWEAFLIKDEEFESSDVEYDNCHKIMPIPAESEDQEQLERPRKRQKLCILC